MDAPDTGLMGTRGSASSRRPVEHRSYRIRTLLRPQVEEGGDWSWSLDPYQGCELACAFCPARLDRKDFASWREFEARIGVKVNAAEVLRRALREQDLEGRPLVLGSRSEPWQQAEERFRVTRSLLEVLRDEEDREVRIHTRSSLIARDIDLLRAIAERNPLTVTFSMASLDEQVNRLMEPQAPSAFRRLAAMEALARAGIPVGLRVAPLLVGLSDEELGLGALLARAAHAGARFACYRFLSFAPGEREQLLLHATSAWPEMGLRYRHVLGARTPTEAERQQLIQSFEQCCARLGLMLRHPPSAPRPRRPRTPTQLSLFAR